MSACVCAIVYPEGGGFHLSSPFTSDEIKERGEERRSQQTGELKEMFASLKFKDNSAKESASLKSFHSHLPVS